VQSWTLSGREAEALHAQEEDEAAANMEDEDEEEDPIKKIIQSRYCSLVLLSPFFCTYSCRYGFSCFLFLLLFSFFLGLNYFLQKISYKSTTKVATICSLFLQYIDMVWYVAVPKYRKYIPSKPVTYVPYNLSI
jgi:hypothetical protein